jgi:hypothetical protein
LLRWKNKKTVIDAVMKDEVIVQGLLRGLAADRILIGKKEIAYERAFFEGDSEIKLLCPGGFVFLKPTTFEFEEAA